MAMNMYFIRFKKSTPEGVPFPFENYEVTDANITFISIKQKSPLLNGLPCKFIPKNINEMQI